LKKDLSRAFDEVYCANPSGGVVIGDNIDEQHQQLC
jgi:hypothetical protein